MPGEDQPPVLQRGLGHGRCKSCSAPIVWAITTAGNRAPFVVDAKGHWVMENGNAIQVGPKPAQLQLGEKPDDRQRYTSHFADCPNAGEWRGQGRDA